MSEKILFALSCALAILAATFSAGLIRDGARNMDELFNNVQIEESE